jgi:hypothetical protein
MLSMQARPGSKNTTRKVSEIKETVRMRLKGQEIKEPSTAILASIRTIEEKVMKIMMKGKSRHTTGKDKEVTEFCH